jgi:hypothetical protein
MQDKILPILQRLSLLYDFSVGVHPEVPECLIDCEGDWILKARNNETAQLIADLLNTLYDTYENKNSIKYS